MGDVFGRRRYDPAGPIFISYRQSDGTELAQRLDRFLRAGGLVPWRDLVDLPPGETARRVHEAFDEGISAAVLLVTPEIERSQFVPQEELPALLALEREPHDFSLTILNTIPKDGPQADDAPYPDATHPLSRCARSAEFDIEAPDRLLKTKDQPLRDLKQYGLEEFRRLYRDLLHRRLRALARSAGWLPTELPGELVAAIRTHAGGLPGDFGIGDGEVTIQTQTRPVPDAQTRRSGTTAVGREHDLAIRLRQDKATGIPAAEDYRHLKETLPILVDGLYSHGVSRVKLTGGGHYSLGWVLGAALPVTRQGGLTVVDLFGNQWTDVGGNGCDGNAFKAEAENEVKGGQEGTDRLRRVAVLIRNSNEQNQAPFDELKDDCDDSLEIVIKSNTDSGHMYPANEGARIAREVAGLLRKHGAGKELCIAWSTATSLAPLVARLTNTLNCVLYELTQNPKAHAQHYQPVLRVSSGIPDGPIVEVFDDAPAEPPTRLINLTPHAVRLYRGDEVVEEWPAPEDGRWVRVDEQRRPASPVCDDVPVTIVAPGGLVDDPQRVSGTGYIVSRLSAQAARRPDFYFPLDEVRDADGNILGVKGLGQFPSGKES